MKKKSLISIVLFALLIASISCCKEKPPVEPEQEKLPELTHEGLNTFGCRVNGEVWVAKTPFSIGGSVPLGINYKEDSGDLTIHATRKIPEEKIFEDITLYGHEIFNQGDYPIHVADDNETGLQDWEGINYECNVYLYQLEMPGSIKITYLNTDNRIISGQFNFNVKSHSSCETISQLNITDGRFDLTY